MPTLAEKMTAALERDMPSHAHPEVVAVLAPVAETHYAALVAAAKEMIAAQEKYMVMQKVGFSRSPGPTIDRLRAAKAAWAAALEALEEEP